jgi:hypothetical protein
LFLFFLEAQLLIWSMIFDEFFDGGELFGNRFITTIFFLIIIIIITIRSSKHTFPVLYAKQPDGFFVVYVNKLQFYVMLTLRHLLSFKWRKL